MIIKFKSFTIARLSLRLPVFYFSHGGKINHVLQIPRRCFLSDAATELTIKKQKGGWFGSILGMLGVLTVGGVSYRLSTDEGSRRSVEFWSTAFPIYLHYRWVEWRMTNAPSREAEAEFDRLHDQYAPVAEALTLKMKGFYLKNAQTMQDEVPTSLEPGQARRIVEESTGRKFEDIFSEFDDEPCGSASIGQVHRARLRSTGQEVAIKVQAPGIEQKFRADIKTIKDFVRLAMPQHLTPMDEIEKQFVTEFDYVGEAENLNEIYNNIMPTFGDEVIIPKAHTSLCSKNVLVMDYLHGKRFIDGVKDHFRKFAEMQGKSFEEIEKEQIELMKRPDFKFKDINAENSTVQKYQRILDAKVAGINFMKTCYNYSLGWVLQPMEYNQREVLLNLAGIIATLSKVHGHEIMVNGAFNGDPHPGNILMMPDGRLGLIDYGQVKRLPDESRVGYAALIVALADEDVDKTWEVLQGLGVKSKYGNHDIQYRLAKFWNDNNSKEVTGGRNLQQFIDWVESEDPADQLPEDLVMPGRVSFLLRAVGNAFGIDLHMAKLWKPIAEKVLAENEERVHNSKMRKSNLHRRYSSILYRKKSMFENEEE